MYIIVQCTPYARKNCKVDIGFLIDVSKSVEGHYDEEARFIKAITQKSNLSPNGSHVAVTLFNHRGYLQIKFSYPNDYSSFEHEMDHLLFKVFKGGGTSIKDGLKVAYTQMFSTANGMRKCVPKTLILVTDGGKPGVNFSAWRKTFRNAKIRIVVVGIGHITKRILKTLVQNCQ